MRLPKAPIAIWIVAAALLALTAAPAFGATTSIGAVGEINAGMAPDPMTAGAGANTWTVQVHEATGSYAVPAGYGVITGWRHRTGATSGAVTLKVYRATSTPNRFLTLAANARNAQANTTHDFPVRIRVQPGDRIGISTTTVEVAYNTGNPADQTGFFSFRQADPSPGTIATVDGPPFVGYRADVAARVETDADRDGFGDDSQDRCPTSAATQGPCYGSPALPGFAGCSARSANVLRGTAGANAITGSARGDRIFASAGDDTVKGLAGNDCIDLGSGKDRGGGGRGDDRLLGGPGADRLSGDSGNDRLLGSSGNDRLSGSDGRDDIGGSSGNDLVNGGSGRDHLTGGAGRDHILGGSGNDRVDARDRKRDRISCGRGSDRVTADRVDRVARDCEGVRRVG